MVMHDMARVYDKVRDKTSGDIASTYVPTNGCAVGGCGGCGGACCICEVGTYSRELSKLNTEVPIFT